MKNKITLTTIVAVTIVIMAFKFMGGNGTCSPMNAVGGAFNVTNADNTTSGDTIYLSTLTVNEVSTTGIEENQLQKNISVFPNPSNGQFVIDSPIAKGEIIVYNTNGECVYRQVCKSANQPLDLSSQPNGTYFIKVVGQGESSALRKIILTK